MTDNCERQTLQEEEMPFIAISTPFKNVPANHVRRRFQKVESFWDVLHVLFQAEEGSQRLNVIPALDVVKCQQHAVFDPLGDLADASESITVVHGSLFGTVDAIGNQKVQHRIGLPNGEQVMSVRDKVLGPELIIEVQIQREHSGHGCQLVIYRGESLEIGVVLDDRIRLYELNPWVPIKEAH